MQNLGSTIYQWRSQTMIEKSKLGEKGPLVGRMGYGAMVLEGYYGHSDDQSGVSNLVHAIESGMMIDTADAYGNGHNEKLIAKAMNKASQDAFIATKFGIVFDETQSATEISTGWGFSLPINGTPEYAIKALDESLNRLKKDTVDLWYLHYPDPKIPVEETVNAMAEQVRLGKVKYLGLSNVSVEQIKKAHAVHPISAVQYEYSLWRREAEQNLLPALRELQIALVCWSPLGGGFLTGKIDQLAAEDFRQNNPKYAGDNLKLNHDRFAPLLDVAEELGITPSQLALAWLLNQGKDIFPIPGTRKNDRIDENAKALSIILEPELMNRIDKIAKPGLAVGATLLKD